MLYYIKHFVKEKKNYIYTRDINIAVHNIKHRLVLTLLTISKY